MLKFFILTIFNTQIIGNFLYLLPIICTQMFVNQKGPIFPCLQMLKQ